MIMKSVKAKWMIVGASCLMLASVVSSGAQNASQPVPVSATSAAVDTKVDSRTEPQFQPRNPRYTIRSADVFEVNFELSPEFNQSVTVQPDGYITLKGVGDVHVAGETVPELT